MRWLLALLLLAAPACGGDDDDDGAATPVEARLPDVEGVVDGVDETGIVIDGARYALADDAASVSTYTLEGVPVRIGTFVHAGLDDETDRIQWVATIGIVSDDDPPRVRYTGRLRSTAGGRAFFTDGTALRVAEDLHLPLSHLAVELDPTTDRIVAFTTP